LIILTNLVSEPDRLLRCENAFFTHGDKKIFWGFRVSTLAVQLQTTVTARGQFVKKLPVALRTAISGFKGLIF
jgi:hypothetical protein